MADCITTYDDEGSPCRCDVLLSTTIDQVVLRYIYLASEDIRGHVTDEADVDTGVVAKLSTIDRVVGRDVEVVDITGDFVLFPRLWVPNIVVILRGERNNFPEGFCFLSSLISPRT